MTSAGQACSVWVENLAAILENELARGLGEQNTLWGGEGTIDSSFKMAVMGQTLTEGKKIGS